MPNENERSPVADKAGRTLFHGLIGGVLAAAFIMGLIYWLSQSMNGFDDLHAR